MATWCLQISPSVGAMLSAPLVQGLVDKYFLKGCLLIMAAILCHFFLASVLMRPPELYRKWQKLKQKIEKNRVKSSLLVRDGYPSEPFRARSPTSDSTFSPLARQAMLQRMRSRNDEDEESPASSAQTEKSSSTLLEPEQKQTNSAEHKGHDQVVKRRSEKSQQIMLYGSYDFGISAAFLEQRYRVYRTRTESEKSNKSNDSAKSFLSENSTTNGGCKGFQVHGYVRSSVLCSPSYMLFTLGFTLGIPTLITVLFLPDLGIDCDLNSSQAASLVSISMIGEIIGQVAAVILSYRHIDDFIIITISLIIMGIVCNLLRFFANFFLLVLFSFVTGLCGGPIHALHTNIIRKSLSAEEVASGMCLLHLAQGLSWTIAIPAAGKQICFMAKKSRCIKTNLEPLSVTLTFHSNISYYDSVLMGAYRLSNKCPKLKGLAKYR